MLGYIQSLERERLAALDANPKPSPAVAVVKPIGDQITELMRTLPPAVRDRPWSISEVVEKLEGKFRQRPHAQGVGMALRRLGWNRIRPSGDGGERRLWVPPTS